MTAYLDTSMLVKLYFDEPDSDEVLALINAADAVVTSVVAYAEARAAIGRRRRERLMSRTEAASAVQQLDADWPHFVRIPIDDGLARSAGRLADAHGLRGYDAVHLASLEVVLKHSDDEDVRFSCADTRLARAAGRLG
jgi:predicted nucleic acid-binding protein